MKQSNLQAELDAYLSLRKVLGFSQRPGKSPLENFVKYLEQHSDGKTIPAQLAINWACETTCGAGGSSVRLSLARGFLTYLKAGLPEIEIPSHRLIATPRRPTPYIFSAAEISQILAEAERLRPRHSLRPHTHRSLFGLLACTGLRRGEALNLRMSDVLLDESPPRLLIRNTKFRKSRWVPLHPSTAERLRHYKRLRHELGYDRFSDIFFISEQGGRLHYRVLQRTFRLLLRRVGIEARAGQRPPTLISFRHTFAVQRLRTWYETGEDPRSLCPNLSVYLGHVDPVESYWYLTATPELLGSAGQLFERYATGGAQ